MAKISTYPIVSIPTLNDLLIGTDVENLNETKNFTIGDIADLIIVGSYVPYVGAIADVDLGIHSITASSFIVPGGLSTQFVKADGSLDSTVYQPAGNYITGLSGEATASGPGVATVVLSNGAVIGKVLTGLTITGGSVSSTDTILQAFGKVQNQINSLVGGVQYQGMWDAATNTPTLQSGVGVKGYYYVVSVAGSTNLDGITDWNVGDWAIFDGTAWQQVDNTDTVVSVNGKVGVVILTTTDIAEGTNLYYTDARVRQALSLTTTGNSGASTYNNLTGAFNIPNYTLAGLGGVPSTRELTINGTTYDLSANRSWSVGTVTQINTSGPLTGGPITGSGTIGITQSGISSDGYLSSVDWNTFNNKQNALTNPVTGTGTTYYVPMWTGLTTLGDSIISMGTGVVDFNYNNPSGATINYTNIGTTAYTYSIVMNNVTRNTFHSYTDGNIVQRINSVDVSKNLSTGQLVLPLYTSLTSFPGTGIGYLGFDASGNILTVAAQSLAGYVPYVGATGNVNLGEFGLSTGFVTFDLTPTGTPATQGTMYWDDSRSTVALIMGGTIQHIGQDSYFYVKNSSGSSIPKGTAVRFAGTNGASGHILIVPFLANGTFPSSYFMGVTAETIANGDFGQVVNFGELEGIDTSTYTAGALLYASTTVAGGFQTTAPDAPNNIVLVAAALNSKNNGAIIVRSTLGSNINDDEGVLITSPAIGQVLKYNGSLWVNDSDSGITGTGAPGQVAYFTGATTQAGSNNLFWDNTNGRLGIGTNVPSQALTVNGRLEVSGSFGISGTALNFGYVPSFYGWIQTFGSVPLLLNGAGNNVIIGLWPGSDNGTKLQVYGNTFIKGSGNTNATSALTIQNSASANILGALNDRTVYIGFASGSAHALEVNPTANATRIAKLGFLEITTTGPNWTGVGISVLGNNRTLTFSGVAASSINAADTSRVLFAAQGGTWTRTSGTAINVQISDTQFAPTSGTATYNGLYISGGVNQTGGANGITRGLYIDYNIVAAADFRAIEVGQGITVLAPSTTASASLRLPEGTAPTSPVNGDIWSTTTDLLARINGVSYSLINSGLSGSGAAGQVTFWDSATNITGSNNLFWDNTNGRLGIGTNVPARQLVIYDGTNGVPHVQWANASTGVTNTDGFQIRLLLSNQVHFTNFENSAMYFGNQGITGQMTLFPSGNLLIQNGGTLTDNGQRLQVTGDTLLKGSGNTSATTALTVQNSSGTDLFRVRNDGTYLLGSLTTTLIRPADINGGGISLTGRAIAFGTELGTGLGYQYWFLNTQASGNSNQTGGTDNGVINLRSGFSPILGTGIWSAFTISSTINQTAGANGITRGIYINPTLTSAADWRAIEITSGISILAPSTTTSASLRLPNGVAPTSPVNGDIWSTTTDLLARINNTTYSLINSGLSGSGAPGQVTFWSSATNITGNNNLNWNNTDLRLGVGLAAPSRTLDVGGGIRSVVYGTPSVEIQSSLYNRYLMLSVDASDTIIKNVGAYNMAFNINNTFRVLTLTSSYNTILGSFASDSGQRLQVYGDSLLKGSGNTSATTALTVQNSDGAFIFTARNDRALVLGNSTLPSEISINGSGSALRIYQTRNSININDPLQDGYFIGSTSSTNSTYSKLWLGFTPTTGFNSIGGNPRIVTIQGSFIPTSGTSTFGSLVLENTINQTGGANGITRGLYINPTLTAAFDWRAIEVSAGITVLAPSTTASASLRLPEGTAPTTPVNGDIWSTTTDLLARINNTTYSLINSGLSGSGAAGQVTYWSSATNITGSNNLFWDNTNGRLGIGTNTPPNQLSVSGSIRTAAHIIHTDGCFGCANTLVLSHDNAVGIIDVNGSAPSCDLLFRTKGVEKMRLFGVTGNLLLQNGGTYIDSGERLQVNGTAKITGLITTQNGLTSTGGLLTQNTAANSGRMTLLNLRNTAGGYNAAINSSIAIAFTNRLTGGNWSDDFIELKVYDSGASTSTSGYNFYTHNNQSTTASSVLAMSIYGQSVGIGIEIPNASAILQADSTTKGFLPPRMTAVQRAAIVSPAEGLIIFQTDGVIGLYIYASATWRTLGMI